MRNLDKTAFDINIGPGAVFGALTGALVANKKVKRDAAEEIVDLMIPQADNGMSGNYYQQVGNIQRNMHAIFTPFGVMYVLRQNGRDVVMDQISTDEMNSEITEKFKNKDSHFFENVMINKMRADIDIAERMFAKRMIEQKMNIGFNKNASISEHFDDMTRLIEKKADSLVIKKITDDEDGFGDLVIRAEFDTYSDINKVASIFGRDLEFPGIKNHDSVAADIQSKLDDPSYLAKNAKVAFLADRVMFIVEDKVVAQLPILSMNEYGYEAFRQNDIKYFEDFFAEKLGIEKRNILSIFKKASDSPDLASIFTSSFIHPEFYYKLFESKLDPDWKTFDPEVLIKEIEDVFELEEGLSEIVMNKILAVQSANNIKGFVLKNILAFEKIVRSLNDKPINFIDDERDISLGEFAFALKVLQNVTPFENIYDHMSEGVYDYMASVLAGFNYRLIDIIGLSGDGDRLFKSLDREVRVLIVKFIYGEDGQEIFNKELTNLNLIASQSRILLKEIRGEESTPGDVLQYVRNHMDIVRPVFNNIDVEEGNVVDETVKCIEDNVAVDVFVGFKENQLSELVSKFIGKEV